MKLQFFILLFSLNLTGQVDTFDIITISTDTFIITEHPLTDHFRLSQNSIIVGKSSKELAATFDDPSRVLYRHAGISTANDQANGIIYRGFPSDNIKWSVHGAEIVNPNHTSNAGTFSDKSSASAGGVLGIPFDYINRFEFNGQPSTSIGPDALAGNANFNLNSKGENYFKVGLLGLEYALQTKGKTGLKAHARYSTVGLLTNVLGLDFGGEQIEFYDLNTQLQLSSKFQLVAGAGRSSNFKSFVPEGEAIFFQKDLLRVEFKSYFLYAGLVWDAKKIDHTLMYSTTRNQNFSDLAFYSDETDIPTTVFDEHERHKWHYYLNYSFYKKENSSLGAGMNLDLSNYDILSASSNIYNINILTVKPALLYKRFSTRQSINLKAGIFYDTYNDELTAEPALNYIFSFTNSLRMELNAALVSQMQLAEVYGSATPLGIYLPFTRFPNNNLNRNKSFAASMAIKAELQNHRLILRPFYYYLYDLAVSELDNYAPSVNGADFLLFTELENDGDARNYGVEFLYDLNLKNGWYVNTNLTFFDFKYRNEPEGALLNAQNNFGHIANVSISKSWKTKRDREWIVNVSYHNRGGSWSKYNSNEIQLSPFTRIDMRIQNTFKNSTISLDIQNLLNKKNDSYIYYDEFLEREVTSLQLGLIPVLSWKRKVGK